MRVYTRPPRPPRHRTLGEIVEIWMAEWLVDPLTGLPVRLTDEQAYFLDTFYALDDDGRWTYDRAALRRARGTGKSPLAGYLAAAELCGPVRFAGWDEDGYPIGREAVAPEIQIIATSLEQTKPIMDYALGCWSDAAVDQWGLRIGIEQVIKSLGNRGRIKTLANNPRALRGPRPTCVMIEEGSEWVTSNGGHAAMRRIRGNVAKVKDARIIEFENAYVPGEDSLAERTHLAWMKQVAKAERAPKFRVKILYDSLEAGPGVDFGKVETLRHGLWEASGDATWLDIDRLIDTAYDPDITPSQFRREHLNQIITAEDSVISADAYDRLAAPHLPVPPPRPGDRGTIGVDVALSDDDTAVVLFRLSDRSFHLIHHQGQDRDAQDEGVKWRVDRLALDGAVTAAIKDYAVRGMASDVHPLDDLVAEWEARWGPDMAVQARPGHPIMCDMRTDRRGLTFAFEALLAAIEQGTVHFGQSPLMRQHWLNAKIRPNNDGKLFGKVTRFSKRKVDIVAACLLAWVVGMKMLAKQDPPPSTIKAHGWS